MEVKGSERAECARAMTMLLFLAARHLTETESESRNEKEGVVAEALVAARLGQDEPRTRTQGTEASSVGRMEHGGAGVMGRAPFGWDSAELMEQPLIVRTVLIEAGAVEPGRESAGAHAGRSAELVDTDAGIIGNRGHPGEAEKPGGLGVSVREEGIVGLDVVFGGIVRNAGVSERHDIAVQHWCEDVSDLASLVRTAGGKNDGRGRSRAGSHRASAAR